MGNRKKIASVAFTGVAAAGAVGLATGNARAASTWTINQPNGTAFAGSNTTSATLDAGGVNLTCKPGTAVASGAVSGNGKSGVPAQLATISGATFGTNSTPCSLLGLGVTAKLNKAVGLIASKATAGGVTSGYLGSSISATVTGVGAFSCHMAITGTSVPGAFRNASNTLDINPSSEATLTIKSVTGCDGLFKAGETAFFKANFTTSPALTVSGG